MNERVAVVALLVMVASAACGEDTTSIHLVVHDNLGLAVDEYELDIGDLTRSSNVDREFQLLLPDDMAGTPIVITIRGIDGNEQVAFGTTTIAPVLGDVVDAEITLEAVHCGTRCTLGETVCAADGTVTCGPQSDGCLGFGAVTACAAATPYCSNGACAAMCSDECMDGEAMCSGPHELRTCGQSDTDPCRDWSLPQTCGGSSTCSADVCSGGCEAATCTEPSPATCVGPKTLRVFAGPGTCSAAGACQYTETDVTCPDGCAGGACVSIDGGENFTCALDQNGGIVCWGSNQVGQADPPAGTFTQVAAAYTHACALSRTGTITCWGHDFEGSTVAPTGTFKSVATGFGHSCGVRPSGALVCWGSNDYGQATPAIVGPFTQVVTPYWDTCGLKTTGALSCRGRYTSVDLAGPFVALSAGHAHICGLDTNSGIQCSGTSPPAGAFVAVTAARNFTCGIRSTGSVDCWGGSAPIPPAGVTFTHLGAGETHICGRTTAGGFACWGFSNSGATTPP